LPAEAHHALDDGRQRPAAELGQLAVAVAGVGAVEVDAFVVSDPARCHPPGILGGVISYKDDNGAWLNVAGITPRLWRRLPIRPGRALR
jgi:hypothetical protein